MVALNKAAVAGDQPRADRLNLRVHEFLDWFDRYPVPVIIKEATKHRRIKTGVHSTPVGDLTAFGDWFNNWLAGVLTECR